MPVPCGVPLPVAFACRMMLWVHAFANVVFPTVSKNARKLSPAQLPFLSALTVKPFNGHRQTPSIIILCETLLLTVWIRVSFTQKKIHISLLAPL
jgi:hypothetical protein